MEFELPIQIMYTNWRGESSLRNIVPKHLWYGTTEWHPEEQYFIHAYDVDKEEFRDFALLDFGKYE